MTKCIFLTSIEPDNSKSSVALGLVEAFGQAGDSVGVFRPLAASNGTDPLERMLASHSQVSPPSRLIEPVYQENVADNFDQALSQIIANSYAYDNVDTLICLGTDYCGPFASAELGFNSQIALNLDAGVVLCVSAAHRPVSMLGKSIDVALQAFSREKAHVSAIVVTDVNPEDSQAVKQILAEYPDYAVAVVLAGEEKLADNLADIVKSCTKERRHSQTALAFQQKLLVSARSDLKTIVLPESEDDRILQSAAIIAKNQAARIVLLGEKPEVTQRAADLGLDLSAVEIQSMNDSATIEKFAAEYAKLRAHKGVTIEQAKQKMTDPSYFATMMVHLGLADGMVSGAAHTTANTIRPSLEFIKAKPGISTVSGAFLMCLTDEVLVFADCAVTPEPDAKGIASIAKASAETAKSFGIDPKVALLSYSTGTSAPGASVDKMRDGLQMIREEAPEILVDGPIQFDAAVDATVGQKKLPGSKVAGHANVFVFPDLNAGNITYKAVQRSANAIAIGPMLQGLNKPVNDLSRGALVEDIVNTIIITAIQAQNS